MDKYILSDRLKLTGKFRRVKVRLSAVKSFMELKFMRSKNIFCSHLGFRAPLLCAAQLLVEVQFVFGIQIDYFIDVVLLQSISGVLGLLRS